MKWRIDNIMIGAIIGDIVGSRFEWRNHRSKDFDLFGEGCEFTDDTVMTLAIAQAILKSNKRNLSKKAIKYMQLMGKKYEDAGYGGLFRRWLHNENPQPYNSYGNGSAMRVSACAHAADSLEEAIEISNAVTAVTHNHPEGMKGAEATTVAIYMALHGSSIEDIKYHMDKHYYPVDFTIDDVRDTYEFSATCQKTLPVALEAFYESTGFEDAIRNAISVGGDSDTIAAVTGAIAEAYYGVPDDIREKVLSYLDTYQLNIIFHFEKRYGIVFDKSEVKL